MTSVTIFPCTCWPFLYIFGEKKFSVDFLYLFLFELVIFLLRRMSSLYILFINPLIR